MIVSLIAALGLQARPVPDAATATLDLSRQCLAVMQGDAEPPAVGVRYIPLADGLEASLMVSSGGCSLEVEGWRPDSAAFATQVRDGLLAHTNDWQVTQWREQRVSESGPTRWSTMRLRRPDEQRRPHPVAPLGQIAVCAEHLGAVLLAVLEIFLDLLQLHF